MKEKLKILMLEDSPLDAEIIQQVLLKENPNCEFRLVMTEDEFVHELDEYKPDLILSDNTLPQFNATEALEIFNKLSLHIPFILVTGTVSEEFAAGIIKLGADDYILKDRLTRLPGAIDAAIQKKKTEAAVRHSEEVRMLIMNAALDAIICIDLAGIITVWNPQAENLFGWTEAETIGKKIADVIIPDQYKQAHTNGFDHYLSTGEGPVLNKIIEMSALNKSGNEFPVELAIVAIKQGSGNFFCAFIRDITERKKAATALEIMEKKILQQKIQEQKKISRAIIKAQEEEKNHIGQELHDNINQILAGTKMYLTVAGKKDESIRETLKYPLELIDNSIEEIRLLSSKQVTPLKNIDLQNLINNLITNNNQLLLPGTTFTYEIANDIVSDDLKLNIYRIIQEQLNNIHKHAAAKNIAINITEKNNNIIVEINDDGKGFNVKSKRNGIGLSNMINRIESYNGEVHITSSPGNGCKVKVQVPLVNS